MKQLFGFHKVMLAPGGSANLFFAASSENFMLVDKQVHTRGPAIYLVLYVGCDVMYKDDPCLLTTGPEETAPWQLLGADRRPRKTNSSCLILCAIIH